MDKLLKTSNDVAVSKDSQSRLTAEVVKCNSTLEILKYESGSLCSASDLFLSGCIINVLDS